MQDLKPTKTVYSAAQFLNWQRAGTLVLQPDFQRREVWKKPAKSYFIDSLIRGYPVPIILLRQVQDLATLSEQMEVIDGQQRLRTLLAYIDPTSLADYDHSRDDVTVSRTHAKDSGVAGKSFSQLPEAIRQRLLAYEFSTHVFPSSTGDEQVFRIFARLNSTGLNLNKQEIRNATYHGVFKTFVYEFGIQRLDYWREMNVFSSQDISRMMEIEAVSEFVIFMHDGITAKRQKSIDDIYESHEEDYKPLSVVRARMASVLDEIRRHGARWFASSSLTRATLFLSLCYAVYSHMYGVQSKLVKKSPKSLPDAFSAKLRRLADDIGAKQLPAEIQDAMDKATADKIRRERRYKYMMKRLGLSNAATKA